MKVFILYKNLISGENWILRNKEEITEEEKKEIINSYMAPAYEIHYTKFKNYELYEFYDLMEQLFLVYFYEDDNSFKF